MAEDYGLDPKPSPGMNRIVRHNGCETCDGHRMVQVSDDPEAWGRCPVCNPAPSSAREPVQASRWWEE